MTSNRINNPAQAEQIIASGHADLISMARPFLADAELVKKAIEDRADEINTCMACNQGCLDRIFSGRVSTCLVNPRACRETEFTYDPAQAAKQIAVVGSGPGGMAYAEVAAMRGHKVTLYEAADRIGGQFNMAKAIPGKEDYGETIRFYGKRFQTLGIDLKLNTRATSGELIANGFDEVILATGVTPRALDLPGIDHAKVLSYVDVLWHLKPVGRKVAIVGAGGIGFDVAEFLSHADGASDPAKPDIPAFLEQWGIDENFSQAGGLAVAGPKMSSARQITLLQRKTTRVGSGLNKSTGWAVRSALQMKGVEMIGGVGYDRIDDDGLHITVDGTPRVLDVDNVIICAGQEPLRDLLADLESVGVPAQLIGGAKEAVELDAERAIEEACRLAAAA